MNAPSPNSGAHRALVVVLIVAIAATVFAGWRLWQGRAGQEAPLAPASATPSDTSAAGTGPATDFFRFPADFEPQSTLFVAGTELARRYPNVLLALHEAVGPRTALDALEDRQDRGAPVDSVLALAGRTPSSLPRLGMALRGLWLRDFGPKTVTDSLGRRSFVRFAHQEGRGIPQSDVGTALGFQLDLPVLGSRLGLAGGEVLTNGRGLALVAEPAVTRNMADLEMTRHHVLQNIAALLGCERIVTLPGLVGEPSGHLDRYLVFLASDLVVVGRCGRRADRANSELLDRVAADLADPALTATPLRVLRLDLPDHADGVWRTRTDVVFADGVVLVPTYPGQPDDGEREALAFFAAQFPDRRVVGVEAEALVRDGGGLRRVVVNLPR